MTLSEAQRLFASYLPHLLSFAAANGYELTLGEAYRTSEQAQWDAEHGIGIRHSLHTERLAIDLNVWKDDHFSTDPADYEPFGRFWMSLHPLFRWGGNFASVDADHFSCTWEGRQ